ncbi:MAG: hypothetical protein V4608_09395 [Bacteroidota bacterium]
MAISNAFSIGYIPGSNPSPTTRTSRALMRSLILCKSSFLLGPPLPKRLSGRGAAGVVDVPVPVGFTNLLPPGAGLLNLPAFGLNGAAIACSS